MRSISRLLAPFVALLALCPTAACAEETAVVPLPALAAKIEETSVSGISSGAYMAGQFQIAHSRIVKGAAIIAGGPYGCAENIYAGMMPGPGAAFFNLSQAINGCMLNGLAMFGVPNPARLAERTRRLAEDGRIDPIENVLTDRVYFFSGTKDRTVVPAIVEAAARFYEELGLPKDHLKQVGHISAGHGFVTEMEGLACGESGKPFVVDCDYDQAGAILAFIYGDLAPRAASAEGSLIAFDQKAFTDDLAVHGLADQGYVYVPRSCATTRACRVHIAFHGCAQNQATVGDAFVRNAGFAGWADTNDLIVLFPQTGQGGPSNPQGCWDWWGYTGRSYLTREAPQITAVHRMLEALGRARAP